MAKPGVFKFELNSEGVKAILRSDGVRAHLLDRAERVAAAAQGQVDSVTEDWEVRAEGKTGPSRASATVFGVPMRIEASRRVLGRSIDAAR